MVADLTDLVYTYCIEGLRLFSWSSMLDFSVRASRGNEFPEAPTGGWAFVESFIDDI